MFSREDYETMGLLGLLLMFSVAVGFMVRPAAGFATFSGLLLYLYYRKR